MSTTDHPLIDSYLAAVEREAASLPEDRRRELLTDLREHIAVGGTDDENRIREVLARLGEPRTVANTALAEEGMPEEPADPEGRRAGRFRVRLVMLLLTLAGALTLLNEVIGLIALLTGLALLWNAREWGPRRKALATATGAALPVLLSLAAAFLSEADRTGTGYLAAALAAALLVPVPGTVVLYRAVRV
ncbi:hypothetical protein [Streptomyces sp. NPDC097619]|uniref:HAAS signaling domain-containing protein n=1 Tax=Streptomyces sp. NPDC097619 TaxID=3157228 RepID=UPI00331EDA90